MAPHHNTRHYQQNPQDFGYGDCLLKEDSAEQQNQDKRQAYERVSKAQLKLG